MSVLTRYGHTGTTTAANPRTLSIALAADTARKLIICSSLEEPAPNSTTAITYDGEALIPFGNVRADGTRQDWFYLDIPDAKAAGTYDLVFTFASGSSHNHDYAGWLTVDEPLGEPTIVTNGATGVTSISADADRLTGDLLLSVYTSDNTGSNSGTPLANASTNSLGGHRLGKADQVQAADGTLTVTWTHSASDDLTIAVVNVTQSSAGSSTKRREQFRLRKNHAITHYY
jgi:hypothetical protein